MCSVHSKKIKAFCALDKELVCIDCILSDKHKNHEIISAQKGRDNEEAEIKNVLQVSQENKTKFENMRLSIDSHLSDINYKANENR